MAGHVQPFVAAFATVADAIVHATRMYEWLAVHRVLNAIESVRRERRRSNWLVIRLRYRLELKPLDLELEALI